jgi:DNA-binding NtrC family response regulator
MANILVVEDDIQVSKLFEGILTRTGHSVVLMTNGTDAIAVFSQQPFDLVITDIFMPEKDGLEVIKAIKQQQPKMKVVAISGGGKMRAPVYLNMAKKLGADRTLNKPFEMKELVATVEELLIESKNQS